MTEQSKSSGVWLFDIAASLGIATALVYATGWTYAFHYLDHFGLGLLGLDIPREYFLMYGFQVFKAWWWLTIGYYLLALAMLSGLHGWGHRPDWAGILAREGQVVLVLIAFITSGWLARKQADNYYTEQQMKGFTAFPYVRVWPKQKNSANQSLQALYGALPKGHYRLLLQDKQRLYLIKPPRDGKPARLAVTEVAQEAVDLVRVLP